jgi:hypothetical protein
MRKTMINYATRIRDQHLDTLDKMIMNQLDDAIMIK